MGLTTVNNNLATANTEEALEQQLTAELQAVVARGELNADKIAQAYQGCLDEIDKINAANLTDAGKTRLLVIANAAKDSYAIIKNEVDN